MLYHDCGGSYMTAYTLQNSSFKTGELREVGGGIGMGKTCEPKAFSFQCMTKFTTKKKKKKTGEFYCTAWYLRSAVNSCWVFKEQCLYKFTTWHHCFLGFVYVRPVFLLTQYP